MVFQKYVFIIYNKLLERKKILPRNKQPFKGQTAEKDGEMGDNEEAIVTLSRKM